MNSVEKTRIGKAFLKCVKDDDYINACIMLDKYDYSVISPNEGLNISSKQGNERMINLMIDCGANDFGTMLDNLIKYKKSKELVNKAIELVENYFGSLYGLYDDEEIYEIRKYVE